MNTSMPNQSRTPDPQITVMGTIKESHKTDIIVFSIPLALFEIVCIVTIPDNNEVKSVPVYVKFRVNR